MFTEESPDCSCTPYNASKAGADHAVRAYVETFALPATITNGNNYGPDQFPEKVIPLFTAKALDDQPLPLYASTQNRREWSSMWTTTAGPSSLLFEHGVVGETYNAGSGVEASIEEIADAVLAATGKPQAHEIVPYRPSHDRRYLLDSTKIRRQLGWEPTVPFEEGLADTVALVRRPPELVEPPRNRRRWWRGRAADRPPGPSSSS